MHGAVALALACYPIVGEHLHEIALHPDRRAHDPHQARKAQTPFRDVLDEAHQQMHEQADPDLPLHGAFIVAYEIVDLAGLLELLEEDLDRPAGFVDLGDRPGAPVEIVGQKAHLDVLPVDLDPRRDAAKQPGIARLGVVHLKLDDLVGNDSLVLRRVALENHYARVLLLADDEAHAAFVELR